MSVDELETIRTYCKTTIRELKRMMDKAEILEDNRVFQQLFAAQSRLLLAKFTVHELLRTEFVEIVYDDDEKSDESIHAECC
jgi:hypothetical protein